MKLQLLLVCIAIITGIALGADLTNKYADVKFIAGNEPTTEIDESLAVSNAIRALTIHEVINRATNIVVCRHTNITASLQWTVTTNWSSAGQFRTLLGWNGEGKDPNVTTYLENGIISSNLIAWIEWKGVMRGVTLESIPFACTNRSYTLKTVQEYR